MERDANTPEEDGDLIGADLEASGSEDHFDTKDTDAEQATPAKSSSAPVLKRRRVTRACDECRKKKIKCDGKQPCTHCTVYSYDCSYDQPSNRRRNPTPQYVEALERRLRKAELLLSSVAPDISLDDPEAIIRQYREAKGFLSTTAPTSVAEPSQTDAEIRSMIASTGELGLDDDGCADFHGSSSGRVFFHRMREQLGDLLGDKDKSLLPNLPVRVSDSPRSLTVSIIEGGQQMPLDLPSRNCAEILCDAALLHGCSILRFVHRPSFDAMLARIYSTKPEEFTDADNKFLPLLYMALATGCLFNVKTSESNGQSEATYTDKIEQGLKYYKAAQALIDVTDCRDIVSLQAIILMTMFLQSSANLNTCWSYIGIAQRAAMRMGLHRNLCGHFDPVEREVRRRVFWVIRKMDIYLSAILGYPSGVSEDDVDQEMPSEVDDEYITHAGIMEMPTERPSFIAATNAHTRLLLILTRVVKYIYPIKGVENSYGGSKHTYSVSHTKIREIEKDLASWLENLPLSLRPGKEGPPDFLRAQQLLRLAYAHVQMMLYRPFLHYVSSESQAAKDINDRSYACAAACVSVSRNIVHITVEMKKRGLLTGAYWFTMYTTFFAILSLVFFVLENPSKQGAREMLHDAYDGKEALRELAKLSPAADRCSIALAGLFDKLPAKLKQSRPPSWNAGRKRSMPTTQRSAPVLDSTQNGSTQHRDLHAKVKNDDAEPVPLQHATKAATFPAHIAPSFEAYRKALNAVTPEVEGKMDYRQSHISTASPTLLSDTNTPASHSPATATSARNSPFDMKQIFATGMNLPNVGAMMFPTSDPFAYPSQQVIQPTTPDQILSGRIETDASLLSMPIDRPPNMEGLEGQILGPMPPWLVAPQMYENGGDNGMDFLMQTNSNGQTAAYADGSGLQQGASTAFDGFFGMEANAWNPDPSQLGS